MQLNLNDNLWTLHEIQLSVPSAQDLFPQLSCDLLPRFKFVGKLAEHENGPLISSPYLGFVDPLVLSWERKPFLVERSNE